MAVRAGMAGLIRTVQRLIGDDPTAPAFDLEDVQDALDARRLDVRYELLQAQTFMQPGGRIVYLDFYAEQDWWEEDAVVYSSAFAPFAAADLAGVDYLTGKWTFVQPQLPVVYLIGKSYDVFGAAAELCEAWAARLAEDYDFKSHGEMYLRSQKSAGKLALADRYKRKARAQTATQVRGDVDGAAGNGLAGALQRVMRSPY